MHVFHFLLKMFSSDESLYFFKIETRINVFSLGCSGLGSSGILNPSVLCDVIKGNRL